MWLLHPLLSSLLRVYTGHVRADDQGLCQLHPKMAPYFSPTAPRVNNYSHLKIKKTWYRACATHLFRGSVPLFPHLFLARHHCCQSILDHPQEALKRLCSHLEGRRRLRKPLLSQETENDKFAWWLGFSVMHLSGVPHELEGNPHPHSCRYTLR